MTAIGNRRLLKAKNRPKNYGGLGKWLANACPELKPVENKQIFHEWKTRG